MEVDSTTPQKPVEQEGNQKPKAKSFYEDKPGRLIIRNLQYDIKQKHLKKCFEKFGEVIDVNVPLNQENSLNKGFGFIEFKTREEARKAIEAMNAKNYKGRMVSVDFAMSKKKYNRKIDDIIQKNPTKLKPKSKKVEEEQKDEVDSWDEGLEDIDVPKPKKLKTKETEKHKNERRSKKVKAKENDVSDGLTLFVRNIDYSTTEEELEEFFGDFGEVQFAKLVKSHDNPQVHKGCAFIKFTTTEPVESLSKLSDEYWKSDKRKISKAKINDLEGQLEFKGRRLVMFKAESKKDRDTTKQKESVKEDKRHMDLLKIGLVTTKDFVHGPVSESDMETRIRLFKEKQEAFKKNPNLFVSQTRM